MTIEQQVTKQYIVQEWQKDTAINVGVDTIIQFAKSSNVTGITNYIQVRSKEDSQEYLYDLAISESDGYALATSTEEDSIALHNHDKAYLVWDAEIDGTLYRVKQGYVGVKAIGTGLPASPLVVDINSAINDLQEVIDVSVVAQDSLQETIDGSNDAINDTLDEAQSYLTQSEIIRDSLNAASGFAFESLGAVSNDLDTSAAVVDVAQVRYRDAIDGGALLRMSGVPELDIVLTETSITFYKKDGVIWNQVVNAASSDSDRNFWNTSSTPTVLEYCNAWVFIGFDESSSGGSTGYRLINLLSRELFMDLGGSFGQHRGLLLTDDVSKNMPNAWSVKGEVMDSSEDHISDASMFVSYNTAPNPNSGNLDPSIVFLTDEALMRITPLNGLDDAHSTKYTKSTMWDKTGANNNFSVSALGSVVEVYRDVYSDAHPARRCWISTDAGMFDSIGDVNDIALRDDYAVLATTDKLVEFKLSHDPEKVLWRHRKTSSDTLWLNTFTEICVTGSTLESNIGSGSDLTEVGSVTSTQQFSGADHNVFNSFSTSNYLTGTLPTAIGTGDFHIFVSGFKSTSGTSLITIGDISASANPVGGILLHVTSPGLIRAYMEGVNLDVSEGLLNPNEIYSIDVVRSSGVMSIYVDGILRSSSFINNNLSQTAVTIGNGFWSPSGKIFRAGIGYSAPSKEQIAWMHNHNSMAYKENAKAFLPVSDSANSVHIDCGSTYVSSDGASNDPTIFKIGVGGLIDEEIQPQSIFTNWTDSDVDRFSVSDGEILAKSNDIGASSYQPAIDPREYLKSVDQINRHDESFLGLHELTTSGGASGQIWSILFPEYYTLRLNILIECFLPIGDLDSAYTLDAFVSRDFGSSISIQTENLDTILLGDSVSPTLYADGSERLALDVEAQFSGPYNWKARINKY